MLIIVRLVSILWPGMITHIALIGIPIVSLLSYNGFMIIYRWKYLFIWRLKKIRFTGRPNKIKFLSILMSSLFSQILLPHISIIINFNLSIFPVYVIIRIHLSLRLIFPIHTEGMIRVYSFQ